MSYHYHLVSGGYFLISENEGEVQDRQNLTFEPLADSNKQPTI